MFCPAVFDWLGLGDNLSFGILDHQPAFNGQFPLTHVLCGIQVNMVLNERCHLGLFSMAPAAASLPAAFGLFLQHTRTCLRSSAHVILLAFD